MAKISKPTTKRAKPKLGKDALDITLPATAAVFRAAAIAYTKKATKTKATAVNALRRERILTKRGQFTKAYAAKG